MLLGTLIDVTKAGWEHTPTDDRVVDRETVQRMAEGDPEALASVYDRHIRSVFGLAMRVLQDQGDAEDVVQEVFSQAWTQAKRYDATRGSVASWLLMMSRSRAIDRLRSRRAKPDSVPLPHETAVVGLPDPALGAEHGVLTAESVARLRAALTALPLTQRVAIELAYFEGLTQTQIATRLEQPLGTVKTPDPNGPAEAARGIDDMSDSQHAPFDGLAPLYAVGALGEDDRTAFETHLEVCLECVSEVKSLLPVTHGLVHSTPPLDAPAPLRARVLGQVTGTAPALRDTREPAPTPLDALLAAPDEPDMPTFFVKPRRRGPGALFWLAATLLVAAAGGGGWYVAELDRQVQGLRAALNAATRLAERAEAETETARAAAAEREAVLSIVTGPGVQQLDLAGQPLAPRASARALWNDAADMVFIATGLPSLPAGDVYQLWFVLPDAPVSATLLEPDQDGDATVMLEVPNTVTLPAVMAMTVEPAGGVLAPTGALYLLGQPAE